MLGTDVIENTGPNENQTIQVVSFELEGLKFTAMNAGPVFNFTPAISFTIDCETQEEIDYYWNALSEGGDPSAQQCGWLADKFGLSWQVVPSMLVELEKSPDRVKAQRVIHAMLQMKKLVIADLQKAYDGE